MKMEAPKIEKVAARESKDELTSLNEIEIKELNQKILKAYNNIYAMHRLTYRDDMFLVGKGCLPDGTKFEEVNGDLGSNFDAHGIAKTEQLKNLLDLLRNGIDKNREFYTAPFKIPEEYRGKMGGATASGEAYKEGIGVIVSGFCEKLIEKGIKIVFINDVFAEILEPLKKLFPQYKIYLLSEQKKVLQQESNQKI